VYINPLYLPSLSFSSAVWHHQLTHHIVVHSRYSSDNSIPLTHALTFASCMNFSLPWCIAVGTTIMLHLCFLTLLSAQCSGLIVRSHSTLSMSQDYSRTILYMAVFTPVPYHWPSRFLVYGTGHSQFTLYYSCRYTAVAVYGMVRSPNINVMCIRVLYSTAESNSL